MKKLLSVMLAGTAFAGVPCAMAQGAAGVKTEFWMGSGVAAVNSFMAHKDKIDIISPTWYQIDETGLVTGEPNEIVLKAAKSSHLTVIPLFAIFDHVKIHQLINDQKAQDEMNKAFLRECKEHGYDGINYDVEDVMWTDRDALSAMVKKTADLLHSGASTDPDRRGSERSGTCRVRRHSASGSSRNGAEDTT